MKATKLRTNLRSRLCVTWSVQLWDENDNPGETSEAYFETLIWKGHPHLLAKNEKN